MSFCDISKAHTDVFENDFPSDWGVEFTASGEISTVTLNAVRTDAVATSIKVKHICSRLGGDVTTSLASSGDAKVEVSLKDKLPKGLKIDIGAEFPKTRIGHFTGEWNNEHADVKVSVNHDLQAKKTDGAVCALFTHNQFSAGGAAYLELGTGLTSASFGARYKNDQHATTARIHHKDKKLTADVGVLYHLQENKGDVAGQVLYDVDKKEAVVQIGFSRTLDDASWKAKVGSDAIAAFTYTHNWNKTTKVTTAVEFNVLDPSKAKAGVQVKYSD